MKKCKKIVAIIIIAVMVCQLQMPSQAKTPKIKVSSKCMIKGKQMTVSMKYSKKKVKWSVSKKSIIKIVKKKKKSVKIKALKPGTAYVKGRIGKKTYKVKIKVIKKKSNKSSNKTNEKKTNTTAENNADATIHKGEGTYYTGGYIGGAANLDAIANEYDVCALNTFDYDNAKMAGAYLKVTGPKGSVNVLVTDRLPEGKKGDVDLNKKAFLKIANEIDGRVNITWKVIAFPTKEPVEYVFKEGSTRYWCGIQVRKHKYPIAKLEVLNQNGKYVSLERKEYNFFESDQLGAGPFTIRVTDIYGHQIIDHNIKLNVSKITKGKTNF